jgi:putrescine:ornithine antiporter
MAEASMGTMAGATAKKKMNLVQLTFIVAVNMMGSGIIMLPANMARVGAISLLSWVVTALGSMAIAYGFAQAGLFNQRPGGMSAYAEDAYGKPGYFLVFLLYFLSLAVGNVAIGISAVGYLAGFFHGLTATPIATCISLIVLLWITSAANFGGPSITGRIGSVTVWGVIIPVGLISIFGWFWFSGSTFSAAWNPNGLSLGAGMASSISLTLWAFLGMESAAQNSDAVENPKRDVPLACMLGTLGAAFIYILSTTVIQGIVPNAELAQSTGPFALAYAKMFNPVVGSIIMALAVLACVGSLLGWQFTIAQTAKSAADERMFPRIFSRVNSMGAPVAGMIVLGIAQTLLALMTISPSLNEQFGALVNLAVVTNVVPYIIALSALIVMMKAAGVSEGKYRLNAAVATIGMLYSVFAIYASGKDAVLGGMLVTGIAFVIWGFIAPRFTVGIGAAPAARPVTGAAMAGLLLGAAVAFGASVAQAQTLDHIRSSGTMTLGYRTDARPFSFNDPAGQATGYTVRLCTIVADRVKAKLALASLPVKWVPLELGAGLKAVQDGSVDLLCGANSVTLARREVVSFSIPIFPSGIGAMLSASAAPALREVLTQGRPGDRPIWRGSPALTVLQRKTFSAVAGTTSEAWLKERLATFKLDAEIVPVNTYDEGIRRVLDGSSDVFFGDLPILLDAAARRESGGSLIVLDRHFTYEPVGLAMRRGDEDFRLIVDRALSELYRSEAFHDLFGAWFGAMDEATATFFRQTALPE